MALVTAVLTAVQTAGTRGHYLAGKWAEKMAAWKAQNLVVSSAALSAAMLVEWMGTGRVASMVAPMAELTEQMKAG